MLNRLPKTKAMEQQATFRILFWLNTTKMKDTLAPIYARVTLEHTAISGKEILNQD